MLRDLHKTINKHPKEFGLVPKGIPPNRDHDHSIDFQLRSIPNIN